MVNRNKVKQTFAKYTSNYDIKDEKIRLKVEHTYKVAKICERIAIAEKMSAEDIDLAWLLGMLHDIGRFEQIRKYGTFIDAVSVDHAEFGADILFGDGKIREYLSETGEDQLIEKAIRAHNKYRVPEELTTREHLFADILRDADKVDILRVNVQTPIEEIYNVTTEELKKAEVTPEVMQAFCEHHTIQRSFMNSAVDHLVGQIAFVFELVYPESLIIVKEQGFVNQMMDFQSENEKTSDVFQTIKKEMEQWFQG